MAGKALRMTDCGVGSDINGKWLIAAMFLLLNGSVHATSTAGRVSPVTSPLTAKVLGQIPHSGYSEGLDFHEGFLWHALPQKLLKIAPADGTVVAEYTPATDYSESLTWFKGSLFNVSFSNNGLYKGKLAGKALSFTRIGSVPEVHAWGLTNDGTHLIVTGDFSKKLYFLNPDDGKLVRQIETPVGSLEDLAWDGKGIWTSSFTEHKGQFFRVHPKTGAISRLVSLPDTEACPVIDGMAWDGKSLWVTGKHCPVIYRIQPPSESELKAPSR